MVIAEILTAGGVMGLIAMIFRWQHSRLIMMEKKHCSALYKPNHQPIYMTIDDCIREKHEFIGKIDEIKVLIMEMDRKREDAKDEHAKGQISIERRLTAIETRLSDDRIKKTS